MRTIRPLSRTGRSEQSTCGKNKFYRLVGGMLPRTRFRDVVPRPTDQREFGVYVCLLKNARMHGGVTGAACAGASREHHHRLLVAVGAGVVGGRTVPFVPARPHAVVVAPARPLRVRQGHALAGHGLAAEHTVHRRRGWHVSCDNRPRRIERPRAVVGGRTVPAVVEPQRGQRGAESGRRAPARLVPEPVGDLEEARACGRVRTGRGRLQVPESKSTRHAGQRGRAQAHLCGWRAPRGRRGSAAGRGVRRTTARTSRPPTAGGWDGSCDSGTAPGRDSGTAPGRGARAAPRAARPPRRAGARS